MLIAAVVAGVVMSAEVSGQIGLHWAERAAPSQPLQVTDEGTAIAVWEEPMSGGARYVFVTGYGTNMAGGTFIVTYRYDTSNGGDRREAFYPPETWTTTTSHSRATSIAVDPVEGDVYVVGSTTNLTAGDTDYIILKYDRDLDPIFPQTGWQAVQPDGLDGVRRYAGPAGGNDRAVDVVYASPSFVFGLSQFDDALFITGTSWGGASGDDIVTLRIKPENGDGVWDTRYNGPGNGPDSAVEMAWVLIVDEGPGGPQVIATHPIVAGTSYGNGTGLDIVTLLHRGTNGDLWRWADNGFGPGVRRYNGPANGDDLCSGITGGPDPDNQGVAASAFIVVSGTTPSFPVKTAGDTDYVLVSYFRNNGATYWPDNGYGDGARAWDPPAAGEGPIDDNASTDVAMDDGSVWVTGRSRNGAAYDIGTAIFQLADDDPLNPPGTLLAWNVWGLSGVSDERAIAITPPYVTGWHVDPNTEPSHRYLSLRYSTGFPLSVDAGLAHYGENLENVVNAAVHGRGTETFGIFVTGRSASFDHGLDILTIRWNP